MNTESNGEFLNTPNCRSAQSSSNPHGPACPNPQPLKLSTSTNTSSPLHFTEYAKSGTDDSSAGNKDAAFDPNITDPQEAKKKAGEGNEVNPLEASPADPDFGAPTREESSGEKGKK